MRCLSIFIRALGKASPANRKRIAFSDLHAAAATLLRRVSLFHFGPAEMVINLEGVNHERAKSIIVGG